MLPLPAVRLRTRRRRTRIRVARTRTRVVRRIRAVIAEAIPEATMAVAILATRIDRKEVNYE